MMLTRWYDIDRELAALDEMSRRWERLFGDRWPTDPRAYRRASAVTGSWPRVNLFDTGPALMAVIELPGMNNDNVKVEVHNDVLTLSGERTVQPPEGYRAHRVERGSRTFSRSFGLPTAVDAEKTKATLSNGLLTVTMEKRAEAQPRRITVSAS